MDILRVKDDQGQWRDIPALVGPQGETGPQGPPGADGIDGVSPTASVEQTASGATITVTDAQGTTTANLTNGQDGQDGSPGTDGADGQSAYVWIRYSAAQPTQDSDMKTTPDAWMGIYSGDSATAPTAYTAYTWYNIKGQTGPVSDVQVNGASVVTNGVANVPVGSSTLDGLSDVNVSGAEVGDSVIYLGSDWTPGAPIKNYEIEDDGNGNPCIYSLYDIVRHFNAGYFVNVFDTLGTDESPNYAVTNAVSYTDGDDNTVNICELQRMKPNGKIEKRIFADRWDETLQDTVYREETPTGMVSNTITLTQSEYDTLVNAGTVDPQTLYCIKESGS